MKWGTDHWGDGLNNGNFDAKAVVMSYGSNDLSGLIDSTSANFVVSVSDVVAFLTQGSGQSEQLFDGSGRYNYVFSGGVTNDENAVIASYTISPGGSSTWTKTTNSSTTWAVS